MSVEDKTEAKNAGSATVAKSGEFDDDDDDDDVAETEAETGGFFKVGVAPETLRRTNLGSFTVGTRVNLERATMAASRVGDMTTITTTTTTKNESGSVKGFSTRTITATTSNGTRIGGHNVQGHVDTVALIEHLERDGNSLRMRFRPRYLPSASGAGQSSSSSSSVGNVSRSVLRHVIEKGYIAIDGTSLTITAVNDYDPLTPERRDELHKLARSVAPRDDLIAAVDEDMAQLDDGWFEVMLIAYTQEKVVQAVKRVGEWVNIEVDMAAKYIDKSVQAYFNAAERTASDGETEQVGGLVKLPVLEKLVNSLVEMKLAEIAKRS